MADAAAPDIFKLWGGIACLGGVLERRVYIRTRKPNPIYPNMYIVLVAPPATGKDQAIGPVKYLWNKVKGVHLAPDSMTPKGLLDELADPVHMQQMMDLSKGFSETYHHLIVAVSELGIIIEKHDLNYLAMLAKLYDCDPDFKERSRSRGEAMVIKNPALHILSGIQPKYMGELFPEQAYGMGFMSRLNLIYAGESVRQSLFGESSASAKLETALVHDLHKMYELRGQFALDQEAMEAMEQWFMVDSQHDQPSHSKLQHYNSRRILHILKLCMIKSASRSDSLRITLRDFEWALQTLRHAESFMPEIFKEISSGGQQDVMEEAFHFVMRLYSRKKKPVAEHKLVHFLSTKVPANQITYIISTMVDAKMLKDANEDLKMAKGAYERLLVPNALNVSEDI